MFYLKTEMKSIKNWMFNNPGHTKILLLIIGLTGVIIAGTSLTSVVLLWVGVWSLVIVLVDRWLEKEIEKTGYLPPWYLLHWIVIERFLGESMSNTIYRISLGFCVILIIGAFITLLVQTFG